MSFISKLAAAGLLVGALSVAPAIAQQDSATNNPATPSTATATAQQDSATTTATPNTATGTVRTDDGTVRYEEHRGFDWGWLGLLGLFGLLGLRKPTNVVYQDRDRVYQDRDRTTTR